MTVYEIITRANREFKKIEEDFDKEWQEFCEYELAKFNKQKTDPTAKQNQSKVLPF